jgi:hypothetical protein
MLFYTHKELNKEVEMKILDDKTTSVSAMLSAYSYGNFNETRLRQIIIH